MVSRYYITKKCRTNDRHAIHKENCPFLSDDENIILLGHFLSTDDAVAEGYKHFDHSQCCRFCIPEKKEKFAGTMVTSPGTRQIVLNNNEAGSASDSSLYYILN